MNVEDGAETTIAKEVNSLDGEWLSARDLTICRYSHLTYVEMGTKMGIPPRTVKAYTDRVRNKLGVAKKRHIQDRCRELGIDYE